MMQERKRPTQRIPALAFPVALAPSRAQPLSQQVDALHAAERACRDMVGRPWSRTSSIKPAPTIPPPQGRPVPQGRRSLPTSMTETSNPRRSAALTPPIRRAGVHLDHDGVCFLPLNPGVRDAG